MGSVRAVVVSAAIVALGSTYLDEPLVAAVVLPFLVGLLAAHVDRESGALAELVVRGAAALLPRRERADFRDEWLDHVHSAGEHGLIPLTRGLSIALIAAPSLAVGLRVGRRRRSRG